MAINWDDVPENVWPFVAHGVEFSQRGKDQWVGTAPFSSKPDHLFVNPKNGLWDEKHLGLKGNDVTFLQEMAKHYRTHMTELLLEKLANDRGLPVMALVPWGIGWDGTHYMLPIVSAKNTVRDILRWSFKNPRPMMTKGRKVQLFNVRELVQSKKNSRVYLCEGYWDTVAMRWALKKLGRKGEVAIGIPGAGTFKDEWVDLFRGHDNVVCYDNDEAGDKGATLVREKFFKAGIKPSYLNWPEHWSDGHDVRDHFVHARKKKIPLEDSWEKLESLIEPVHRQDDGSDEASARGDDDDADTFLEDDEAPTFEELVEKYAEYLEMDDEMVRALLFVVCIVYSNQIKTSEPLWAYLVAPAGAGKTVILSSMAAHRKTFYRSTVTPNSLVSGFRSSADPSILPKMNGKTFIIKDFTATLAGPEFQFEETMAILRDAFDGEFTKSYGNDVVRSYKDLHFSIVAGVTPAIHAKPMATMGERFLKCCMGIGSLDSQAARIRMTFRSEDMDTKMHSDLQDMTSKFLSRKMETDELPDMPAWFEERLTGMALLVSRLRAEVKRDMRDSERLMYRPGVELGSRVCRQLRKLAMAMLFSLRKKAYDEEVWKFVERIALDTCTGFNLEVVQTIKNENHEMGMSTSELCEALDLSHTTVTRTVTDLEALRVLRREQGESSGGRRPTTWKLTLETRKTLGLAGQGRLEDGSKGAMEPRKRGRRTGRSNGRRQGARKLG